MHCFSVGFGLTESSPTTHVNPSDNYRYDSSGVAVPNTEYKVRFVGCGSQQLHMFENNYILTLGELQ